MPDGGTWQRPQFVNRVGDPATKDGAADLMRRSPIARVDAISKPLLVTNGANDPRVFPDQSEEIVDALKARGKPVTYAFYPDEGHVYAKARPEPPETRRYSIPARRRLRCGRSRATARKSTRLNSSH